jgi:hypothetical protein
MMSRTCKFFKLSAIPSQTSQFVHMYQISNNKFEFCIDSTIGENLISEELALQANIVTKLFFAVLKLKL